MDPDVDTPQQPKAVPHMEGQPWPRTARTTDARQEALDETVL
jgi:hypothetical protein